MSNTVFTFCLFVYCLNIWFGNAHRGIKQAEGHVERDFWAWTEWQLLTQLSSSFCREHNIPMHCMYACAHPHIHVHTCTCVTWWYMYVLCLPHMSPHVMFLTPAFDLHRKGKAWKQGLHVSTYTHVIKRYTWLYSRGNNIIEYESPPKIWSVFGQWQVVLIALGWPENELWFIHVHEHVHVYARIPTHTCICTYIYMYKLQCTCIW